MMSCSVGIVGSLVDAENDGDVLVLCRRGDHDLFGSRLDMGFGVVRICEEAGRLDDDIDATVTSRGSCGCFSAKTAISLPLTVSLVARRDLRVVATIGRVVGEKRRQGLGRRQVIDGDDLEQIAEAALIDGFDACRPILPNPLMPTWITTEHPLFQST